MAPPHPGLGPQRLDRLETGMHRAPWFKPLPVWHMHRYGQDSAGLAQAYQHGKQVCAHISAAGYSGSTVPIRGAKPNLNRSHTQAAACPPAITVAYWLSRGPLTGHVQEATSSWLYVPPLLHAAAADLASPAVRGGPQTTH